jgi:toxin-antitoxin system PIN domain toxin
LRLVANPRVFERPPSLTEAWEQVERWLEVDSVWIPVPTERHHQLFAQLLTQTSERSDLVPDAHLAALAIEHGLTLYSTDGDFARFSGLRWENPLAS